MGIKPLKHLGQNFLTDHSIIDRIVDSIQADPGMPLVEIGPGTGALTGRLRMRYPHYRAIEIDTRSVELLKKQHSGIDILQMDVLDPSWIDTLPSNEKVAIIGNLPYYITSPIIFLLIDRRERFSEAVIMVQKEVAERLVATPGHREYGILSVQVQLAARVELLFKVPNTAFHPVPKVESAVLRLVFDKPRPDVEPEHLRRVIRQAFSQKRKMLRNTLAPMLPADKALSGWDLSRRAETLSLDEFVTLAKDLKRIESH